MDAQRFDRITKTFAARVSRRGLMRGLAALSVGGLSVPSRAGARRAPAVSNGSGPSIERTDALCKGRPAMSNKLCPFAACGTDCECAMSVNGDKKCVVTGGVSCPSEDECDRNRDCAAGEFCIKVGGCCTNPQFNQCLLRCN
jgi:hypothetical protein